MLTDTDFFGARTNAVKGIFRLGWQAISHGAAISLVLAVAGCSLVQVAPIQIGRVSQTESYTQRFIFLGGSPKDFDPTQVMPDNVTQWQNQRMDDVFVRLLGRRNWQNLKDIYGLGSLREELISGDIFLEGLMTFTIYPDPRDPELFILEGSGRYFLIRKKNSSMLLSGDFYIHADPHSITELNRGFIVANVELFVTRVPNHITYVNNAPLKYKIHIDRRLKDDLIYALDYSKQHEVYLPPPEVAAGVLRPEDRIAIIKIHDIGYDAKLLDLRGIKFLNTDYEKKLREARKRDGAKGYSGADSE